MKTIPFLDLKAQYDSIKEEIQLAILRVLDSCAFAGGVFVEEFEKEFAAYCGCSCAVGAGSGTDALWLCLRAIGVGPGDEVITAANTFFATAEAISQTGARPVFVDVEEDTYTMDPGLLQGVVTPRTKAIVPVHLFGQCADMDPIMEIAAAGGLYVIEDACQAHGAEYKGRKAGSMGHAAAFSFYPGKNLGAYGEAGAVLTNDQAVCEKVRRLRDHGQRRKYYHDDIGWNARMDGIQGAVLQVKLRHLDGWNQKRRDGATLYGELLSRIEGVAAPEEAPHGRHVYHIYAVRVSRRDEVLSALKERGVACGIHYPVPVHLQKAYRHLGYAAGSFPVSERCAGEFLSLPMYPELENAQIRRVVESLTTALGERHAHAESAGSGSG